MNSEMKIKSIAPWFGGKRTMAPEIIRELGRHTQYFEPFCGSMAVLFAKEASQKETVNDLHGDLINLARCIQHADIGSALYDRIQRVTFCDGLLEDAREALSTPLDESDENSIDPDRAYWYFLGSWMGRNGTAGTDRQDYQLAVRWTKSGGSPTVRWRNAVDSMPWWHRRLQNVVILRRDAFNILPKFEDVTGTAIYIDSPYSAETRSRLSPKNGRGGRYLHEFKHDADLHGPDDHTRLRDILCNYQKARVVVSYYDSPRIRELYEGWTIVEHTRHKHLHVQNGRGSGRKEAPELLLINGPSLAGEASAA